MSASASTPSFPDVEETLKWSMPAYTLGGKIVLITAAFKAHMALNFWRGQELRGDRSQRRRDGPVRQAQRRSTTSAGRRARRLIREAAELAKSAPAPRKTKHVPKPPPEMHPDFAAALAKAPKAKAALDGFPPSAQRDYFEWIGEAKQDATRAKRIADRDRMAVRGQKAALEV